MTPEEIKSMQAYAAAAFGQSEAGEQFSEDGKVDSSDAIIAALRVTVDEPKSLTDRVIETYEARLNEHKQALEEATAGIHELCRMLNIGVTWSDVPGLEHSNHDLLAQITKSVLSLKDKVKLAKPYVSAVDKIHAILTNNGDDREFTPDELRIFDIAEDTLMGIAGAANGGDESA